MTLIEAIRISRDNYEWMAIDKNGCINAYVYRPIIDDGSGNNMWFIDYGCYEVIGDYTGYPIPWEESLIELDKILVK